MRVINIDNIQQNVSIANMAVDIYITLLGQTLRTWCKVHLSLVSLDLLTLTLTICD